MLSRSPVGLRGSLHQASRVTFVLSNLRQSRVNCHTYPVRLADRARESARAHRGIAIARTRARARYRIYMMI